VAVLGEIAWLSGNVFYIVQEVDVLIFRSRFALVAAIVIIGAQLLLLGQPLAQPRAVSIIIVRHAETDT